MAFAGGSVVKNSPANTGDVGLTSGLGRSPGEGNGKPFQYSCLEIPMDRGAWQATIHGVAKESDTTQQLNSNNKVHTQTDLPIRPSMACSLPFYLSIICLLILHLVHLLNFSLICCSCSIHSFGILRLTFRSTKNSVISQVLCILLLFLI